MWQNISNWRTPSPGRLSLPGNFKWNLAGNLIYAACQWGMVVILAKLTNPAVVGKYALGLALTTPIILFSQLQLRSVQATDAKGEYDFRLYLTLRLATTALALLTIGGVVAWVRYEPDTTLIILAIGVVKALESISDIFYGFMQRQERMDRIAQSRILKGILSLGGLALVIALTRNLFWAALSLAAITALLLLTYDMHNVRHLLRYTRNRDFTRAAGRWIRPHLAWKELMRLAWLALPLGVAGTLISLFTNIPRYFLERSWGERELGIFAALAYLMLAGTTIVGAMGQSVVPRLATYYAHADFRRYHGLLMRLLATGVVIGIGGVTVAALFAEQLLTWLYRPEYAEHSRVFILVMWAGAGGYLMSGLGFGLTATRRFKTLVLPYGLIALVALMAGYGLIPSHGLLGAAWALVATNFAGCFILLLLLWLLRRRSRG